jgi:hypothetical protein
MWNRSAVPPRLGPVQELIDLAAGDRVRRIGEAKPVELALVREARRDREVQVFRMLRIPGRILRPLPLCHACGNALRLQLGSRLVPHVDEVGGGERGAGRHACVGRLRCEARDLDSVELAAREAGTLGGITGRLLLADVDVHLAGRGVVRADDDRLAARRWVGDGILERVLAEGGQLPADPALGVRERASLVADLLAAEEEWAVVAGPRALVVDRRERREVSRAEPADYDSLRGWVVGARCCVPRRDPDDVIASGGDAEVLLPDDEARDEAAGRAVVADSPERLRDLVVRQDRECAGSALVGAQAVGQPGQPVAVDRVADGENRDRTDAVLRRDHVRGL